MSRDKKVKQFLLTSSRAEEITNILNYENYDFRWGDTEFFFREIDSSIEYNGHLSTKEKDEVRTFALGIYVGLLNAKEKK